MLGWESISYHKPYHKILIINAVYKRAEVLVFNIDKVSAFILWASAWPTVAAFTINTSNISRHNPGCSTPREPQIYSHQTSLIWHILKDVGAIECKIILQYQKPVPNDSLKGYIRVWWAALENKLKVAW